MDRAPSQDAANLVWVDMEMTGLDPDNDRVIEIATIVTDSELNTLAEGPVIEADDLASLPNKNGPNSRADHPQGSNGRQGQNEAIE